MTVILKPYNCHICKHDINKHHLWSDMVCLEDGCECRHTAIEIYEALLAEAKEVIAPLVDSLRLPPYQLDNKKVTSVYIKDLRKASTFLMKLEEK